MNGLAARAATLPADDIVAVSLFVPVGRGGDACFQRACLSREIPKTPKHAGCPFPGELGILIGRVCATGHEHDSRRFGRTQIFGLPPFQGGVLY